MKERFEVLPKDKVTGCYRIRDHHENAIVSINGTVFRTKCFDKAVSTVMRLEEHVSE